MGGGKSPFCTDSPKKMQFCTDSPKKNAILYGLAEKNAILYGLFFVWRSGPRRCWAPELKSAEKTRERRRTRGHRERGCSSSPRPAAPPGRRGRRPPPAARRPPGSEGEVAGRGGFWARPRATGAESDGREERGPGPQACRPSVWEFAAPAASARAPASREEGGGRWGSRDGETWARVKWWSS